MANYKEDTMTKLFAWIILVLILISGILGYFAYSQTGRVAVLKEANKSLTEAADRAQERMKADRQVLVARQKKIASQARILTASEEALQNALQRNKSWSDTDVPSDVQKALGGPPRPVPDGL